ncbi:MAG TPA: trypsin-like peptidase domain-containing protein [Terriglobia bacterium]|nr:trypsin-like peptidase domain-containing protein [Terriglobia bacterium]
MRNLLKVAFLSSIITAALVYVILEWKPLRSELSRPPEVSWASSPVSMTSPAPPAPLTDDERNNIDVYQKYSVGVVNITSTSVAYDFFFRAVPQSGMGSGAIIDTQGHIVTNYHVIRDAELLEVTLPNKTKHKAKVVGTDANNDLAVIQIDVPRGGLTPIPLGTSKGLQVGQKVLAIGNPFGLDRTMTTGIISALGRSIQAENGRIIDDIIQTDASINHGNSGGPLLNNQGQIIGINAAIVSPNDTGNYGIGFAIPVDTVRRITDEILKLGYVRHAYLGIDARGLLSLGDNPGLADALDLNTDHGLLVGKVPADGPLAQAGIREGTKRVRVGNYLIQAGGDVILAVNGKDVNSFVELASEVDHHRPGEAITITVLRSNRKADLQVTLQEQPRQR